MNRLLGAEVAHAVLAHEYQQPEQADFVVGGVQQLLALGQRQLGKLPGHLPDQRHRNAQKPISLTILALSRLEEACQDLGFGRLSQALQSLACILSGWGHESVLE